MLLLAVAGKGGFVGREKVKVLLQISRRKCQKKVITPKFLSLTHTRVITIIFPFLHASALKRTDGGLNGAQKTLCSIETQCSPSRM